MVRCIRHPTGYHVAEHATRTTGFPMSSREHPPTRRDFLRTAAAGAAGLALPLAAIGGPRPLASPKSCIFINLVGGPGHLDTFDPKPDARSDIRGPFRPIPTRVPGLHLSELFPKMAGM